MFVYGIGNDLTLNAPRFVAFLGIAMVILLPSSVAVLFVQNRFFPLIGR